MDADINDMRSFAECGGTSIDAVLMTEDIRHAFAVHCITATTEATVDHSGNAKDADGLPLLLDKLLHCPLRDVVQYISSQLGSFSDTTSATAADVADDDDENTVSPETSSGDLTARAEHEIAACIHSDTTSGTGQAADTGYTSQPIHDTKPAWHDVKSRPESDQIAASEPPVKRRRSTRLSGGMSTDAELACTMTGECRTL